MNYYNEFDPNAAAWLKQLIQLNLIPQGDVDTRSITEVKPHELTGYTQCHFFAGIGGWSYALQLAEWPTDRPVWSMSCPCQPFSSAGKGLGAADERHLWPVAFNLIKECRPQYVFGEQVASAIGHGWLDGISSDLGEEGYACGSAVLGAHSVGAPHIRQRLYWMAYSDSGQCEKLWQCGDLQSEQPVQSASCDSAAGYWRNHTIIPCRDGKQRRIPAQSGIEPLLQRVVDRFPGSLDNRSAILNAVLGFPLSEGIRGRVPLLKGYGNAIVPQVAAAFIQAAIAASRN